MHSISIHSARIVVTEAHETQLSAEMLRCLATLMSPHDDICMNAAAAAAATAAAAACQLLLICLQARLTPSCVVTAPLWSR
jgi:hypothetical protein